MIEGPRARLYRRGVAALPDDDLLEIVACPRARAMSAASDARRAQHAANSRASSNLGARSLAELARAAPANHAELARAGRANLAELARASPHELAGIAGIGRAGAARLAAAFELGRRAIEASQRRTFVRTPRDVLALLGPRVAGLRQELFFVIGLDVRHHVLDVVEVARGAVTDVAVHPREVFRPLVRIAAAGAVLAHNHPSGDPMPSDDDIELTRRLCTVGKIVGIPILDHVVIGGTEMRSIAESVGDLP